MSICPSNGLYELQHRGTNIDMQVLVYNTQVDLFFKKKKTRSLFTFFALKIEPYRGTEVIQKTDSSITMPRNVVASN